jgi:hypothetical protein
VWLGLVQATALGVALRSQFGFPPLRRERRPAAGPNNTLEPTEPRPDGPVPRAGAPRATGLKARGSP